MIGHTHNRNEHITMYGIYLFALLLGYTGGVFTVYLYQWLLRRRQRQDWIRRNPRAHSLLVKRLQEEEWSER